MTVRPVDRSIAYGKSTQGAEHPSVADPARVDAAPPLPYRGRLARKPFRNAMTKRASAPAPLQAVLEAGHFAVTAEVTPPVSADPADLLERARPLAGVADAVNVTDGAAARAHMAALAAAALMTREGIDPVMQMTLRDRNRLALQADLMGAAALGVRNVLCLTGDPAAAGDQPEAKEVFDLDSAGLIAMVRAMAEPGTLPSGRAVAAPPRLFVGAADSPCDPPADWRPAGLLKKLDAGARFVQTQYCFDVALMRRWVARLVDLGIAERAHLLIGIGPLRSAKSARWMDANLYGVSVPAALVARLEGAADELEEGIRICVELIEAIRETPGAAGAHLMGPRSEAASAEAIRRSGVREARAG